MGIHHALAKSDSFRVITPDMPGFGGSERTIPDYSVLAHAGYLHQMIDSLKIDEAHLVAYSMSGGIVLELEKRHPDEVASITMLSAIGVQELELMGEYYLNHAVHGLQLGGLWLISEGFPHFGWMDDVMLGKSYARNFYDTDQRPLRNILLAYDGPMKIIHSEDDPLVPYPAAKEHHRLVPQSILLTLDGIGHSLPFTKPDKAARYISSFVWRVESGEAKHRSDVSPNLLRKATLPFDPANIPAAEGFSLFVLIILIVGATLVSEDLACIGAGLMAARGTLTLASAFSAAFGGIVLGDVLLYVLGRSLGTKVVRRPPFSWFIHPSTLEKGSAWFEQKGIRVIFASRFIPGTRLPTYVAAGVLRAPFWKFLFYFLIAAVLWTPAIVGLSTILGNQLLKYYALYESFAIWVLLGLIFLLYAGLHLIVPMFTHRGRRMLISRWRRIRRWEFWPPYVFYPPIVLYVLGLGVKHRSLTAFTAANPGMPDGGFVGESKSAILRALMGPDVDHDPTGQAGTTGTFGTTGTTGTTGTEDSGDVSETTKDAVKIARFHVISDAASGPDEVRAFMQVHNLQFPVVLKPDAGERGSGVDIARTDRDVTDYFATRSQSTIVQEFIPGHEFGIFYYRFPNEHQGRIFSITDKRFPSVIGDGTRTLEDLIMDDDRAVCMANFHLTNHAHSLSDIPEKNETVSIVDIGTHCLGAVFLDGHAFNTAPLRKAMDEVSRGFDGFYFGRYDVRTSDVDAFREGKGFTVLELNGVTSEATHIYDPSHSVFYAYRTLFEQWRIAFEIGKRNMAKGASTTSLRALTRAVVASRSDSVRQN